MINKFNVDDYISYRDGSATNFTTVFGTVKFSNDSYISVQWQKAWGRADLIKNEWVHYNLDFAKFNFKMEKSGVPSPFKIDDVVIHKNWIMRGIVKAINPDGSVYVQWFNADNNTKVFNSANYERSYALQVLIPETIKIEWPISMMPEIKIETDPLAYLKELIETKSKELQDLKNTLQEEQDKEFNSIENIKSLKWTEDCEAELDVAYNKITIKGNAPKTKIGVKIYGDFDNSLVVAIYNNNKNQPCISIENYDTKLEELQKFYRKLKFKKTSLSPYTQNLVAAITTFHRMTPLVT